jgi:molybdopterin/thiamine biosynthesis adenylyltransferase
MLIPEIGVEGQKRLSEASVLVIGAGGLGCPVLQYLAGLGMGTISIADDDVVHLENLHRQILYSEEDIGLFKADVAARKLQVLNSSITIIPLTKRITRDNIKSLIAGNTVVVDCTDNITTRYLIDWATKQAGIPFVYGGVRQFEGQVGLFNYRGSPSFESLFPDREAAAREANCAQAGIVGFTAGLVGCLQVNEVLKVILGLDGVLAGTLITIDLKTMVMRRWHYGAKEH